MRVNKTLKIKLALNIILYFKEKYNIYSKLKAFIKELLKQNYILFLCVFALISIDFSCPWAAPLWVLDGISY